MEAMQIVQARTPERVKKDANELLDQLGLNMSTYINMALNQLIIQRGIPFAVKALDRSYTDEEKINEVSATLRMEGMALEERDVELLKAVNSGSMTADEARAAILKEVRNGR